MTMQPEIASRRVWVMASQQVIDALKKGPSTPVSITVTEAADGQLEMTFYQYFNQAELVRAWLERNSAI